MTEGINEVGDLRLGTDSRERYATRSRRTAPKSAPTAKP